MALAVLLLAGGLYTWRVVAHAGFDRRAQALGQRLDRDHRDGVGAGSVAALRARLMGLEAHEVRWWIQPWPGLGQDGALAALERRTAAVEHAALAASVTRAAQALQVSVAYAAADAAYLPPDFGEQLASWRSQLMSVGTPAAADRLAQAVSARLASVRVQVTAARATPAADPPALLARSRTLVARAQAERLDPGPASALTGSLASTLVSGGDPRGVATQLQGALPALQSLLDLNDRVGAGLRSVMESVDQAYAEATPGGEAERSQYQGLTAAFTAAATAAELQAIDQQAQTLAATAATDLAGDRCGHAVPAGRVITLNLTAQEVVFYEDGCAVRATPATSGRPALRTPTGQFAIFAKYTPFVFHSMWPPGSPFWYPTSPVSFAMEFAGGGYFVHDAPWEPDSDMGPGSEDGGGASHGCVHLPHDVMAWAYSWAGIGTPFIVTA